MNKQITKMLTALLLFATALVNAQAPEGFNYQAVVRDASGNLITSGTVTLNFIIHKGSASGTTIYAETQTATPNQYGQVSTVIGSGTVTTGVFKYITWSTDDYFIETKVSGVSVSNTQFQSVPYALASRDWFRTDPFTLSSDTGTRVGIGTRSPVEQLEVTRGSNARVRITSQDPSATGIDLVRMEFVTDMYTDWRIENEDGDLVFKALANNGVGEMAAISSAGELSVRGNIRTAYNVIALGSMGIGSSTPRFPLEISGTAASAPTTTPANETWFKSTGGLLSVANTGTTSNVSAYADGYFATAQGFVAHSDIRLKNITGVSNPAEDLLTLNKIQVTDYTMRDLTANNGQFKKVIAQQVKQVYPQAVMDIGAEQYVANLYQLAQSYAANGNAVTFVLPKAIEEKDKNDIVVGASVKFYLREKADALCMKEAEGKITAINGNTYTVTANEAIDATVYDKVFVYGTKVNNVLAVDYDAISILNVSATQELAKQVETLKAQNSMLAAANETLKAELNAVTASLKADMELVKSQLNIRSQVTPK
ncbi:MAG: hypothetical protein KA149_00155 [Chitinophagales bacterium]|nr:hypothetical protein [Chitinophagales bacterium]